MRILHDVTSSVCVVGDLIWMFERNAISALSDLRVENEFSIGRVDVDGALLLIVNANLVCQRQRVDG